MSTSVSTQALRVSEIFYSLQGEARHAGIPTVFIRLTGCPLRCRYCDTAYAFTGGKSLALDEILSRVAGFNCRHVTVTGGEPLAQKACLVLLRRLCDAGYEVSLETSGALDIAPVDARVCRVMDLKAPGSAEASRNRYDNIAHLTAHDQVKFVLSDRADYEWMKDILRQYDLASRCEVLVQVAWGQLDPARVGDWILEDKLPVRLQVQLHKLLWGDVAGR